MEKKVLALGFFDGVHKGHAKIIKTAAQTAREKGTVSACLTFSIHPRALVSDKAPELITGEREKIGLIKACGADEVIVLPFDEKTAGTSPRDFALFLKNELFCDTAVCGENFRFGKGAAGTPSDLRENGVATIVCSDVLSGGEIVSSTLIRRLVKEGDVSRAKDALGRPFSLTGKVLHGYRIGSKLSFPTANLAPEKGMLLPGRGVYATRVLTRDGEFAAVTNVGVRPTFGDSEKITVESHIMGFSGELYGEEIKVSFFRKIRNETRFDSAEALKARIEEDKAFAESFFTGEEKK